MLLTCRNLPLLHGLIPAMTEAQDSSRQLAKLVSHRLHGMPP